MTDNRMILRAILAGTALSCAASASAEVARMHGEFAAPNREASYLDRMAVRRIDGRDGAQLALALERAIGNTGYFTIVSAREGEADGIVSGAVTTGVEQNPFTREETKCAEKTDGKCAREEKRKIDCFRRVVTLTASLRIVRHADGAVVYAGGDPQRDETSWCKGDTPSHTVESAVTAMIGRAASGLAAAISPSSRDYQIRFRESRSGMPKDISNRFKGVVKLSQRDLPAACAAWQQIDTALPNHPSVVFDLGLCAEAQGKYEDAGAFYRRAAQLIGSRDNEATEGMDRIAQLIAGREDARRRAARR